MIDKILAFFRNLFAKVVDQTPKIAADSGVKSEPVRESAAAPAQKLLWYPIAHIPDFSLPVKGKYADKYPKGAVVHFTAGRSKGGLKTAVNTARHGKESGYTFFTISEDGIVVQAFPLDSWGYHAGESGWPGLGTGVSSKLVGIEVCCAGRLTKVGDKFKSWFGELYDASEVRYSPKKDNIQEGFYHKYTDKQVKALTELLLWLKSNNPSVFNFDYVVGHDEVAPKRKNDPGAALPLTMPEFRQLLKGVTK